MHTTHLPKRCRHVQTDFNHLFGARVHSCLDDFSCAVLADDSSRVDVRNGVLEIEGSDESDMISVEINPHDEDELAIYILHFTTQPPSLDFGSVEEAMDAADDYRIEHRRRNRIDEIYIEAHHGDDHLVGGDGDDTLNGDSGADELDGGYGDDVLEGSFDGETDLLIGGRGADTFFSKYANLVWKYRKRYNRLTRQWEYSKGKSLQVLESDDVSDLDYNAGDAVKTTIIEG